MRITYNYSKQSMPILGEKCNCNLWLADLLELTICLVWMETYSLTLIPAYDQLHSLKCKIYLHCDSPHLTFECYMPDNSRSEIIQHVWFLINVNIMLEFSIGEISFQSINFTIKPFNLKPIVVMFFFRKVNITILFVNLTGKMLLIKKCIAYDL